MSHYLNPTIVALDNLDFTKLDVSIGSGIFKQSDLYLSNFGVLNGVGVSVDRDGKSVRKSIASENGVVLNSQDCKLFTSTTPGEIPSYLSLNTNITDNQFHLNLTNGTTTDPEQLIRGIVFNLLVNAIFTDVDTQLVDFTSQDIRSNDVFFSGDSTAQLILDLLDKTKEAFSKTVTFDENPDEFLYWNTRTAVDSSSLETETINFQNGDSIVVYYTLDLSFVANPSTDNLWSAPAIQDTPSSGRGQIDTTMLDANRKFQGIETNMSFVLQWLVYPDFNAILSDEGVVLVASGPYENSVQNVYKVDENGIETRLNPPMKSNDEGKFVLHPAWNLEDGDAFIIRSDITNAIDKTLEGDTFDSSPALILSGMYFYSATGNYNVTPATTLLLEMCYDETTGKYIPSQHSNAKTRYSSAFSLTESLIESNHYHEDNDTLLQHTMELISVATSLNAAVTEEGETVPSKVDASVLKSVAEKVKSSSSTLDIGDDSVIGDMIEKTAVKKYGESVDKTKYNTPAKRAATKAFVDLSREVIPTGHTRDKMTQRVRIKKLQSKILREGTRLENVTTNIITAQIASLQDPELLHVPLNIDVPETASRMYALFNGSILDLGANGGLVIEDVSGQGNEKYQLNPYNSTVPVTVPSPYGNAMVFGSTGTVYDFSSGWNTEMTNSEWTISMIIKPYTLNGSQTILDDRTKFCIKLVGPAYHVSYGTNNTVVVPSLNLIKNQWLMLTVTVGNNKVYIYEGNHTIYSKTNINWGTEPITQSYPYKFGANQDYEEQFQGEIANLILASPSLLIDDVVQTHMAYTDSDIEKQNESLLTSANVPVELFSSAIMAGPSAVDGYRVKDKVSGRDLEQFHDSQNKHTTDYRTSPIPQLSTSPYGPSLVFPGNTWYMVGRYSDENGNFDGDELSLKYNFVRNNAGNRIQVDSNNFIWSVWIKPASWGPYRSILTQGDNNGFRIYLNGRTVVFHYVNDSTNHIAEFTSFSLALENWSLLTFKFESSVLYVYEGNRLLGTTTFDYTSSNHYQINVNSKIELGGHEFKQLTTSTLFEGEMASWLALNSTATIESILTYQSYFTNVDLTSYISSVPDPSLIPSALNEAITIFNMDLKADGLTLEDKLHRNNAIINSNIPTINSSKYGKNISIHEHFYECEVDLQLTAGKRTFSFYFKPNSIPTDEKLIILSSETTEWFGFGIYNSSYFLRYKVGSISGTQDFFFVNTTFQIGQWTLVTVVIDGPSHKIYESGVLMNNSDILYDQDSLRYGKYIGNASGSSDYSSFDGKITSILIFDQTNEVTIDSIIEAQKYFTNNADIPEIPSSLPFLKEVVSTLSLDIEYESLSDDEKNGLISVSNATFSSLYNVSIEKVNTVLSSGSTIITTTISDVLESISIDVDSSISQLTTNIALDPSISALDTSSLTVPSSNSEEWKLVFRQDSSYKFLPNSTYLLNMNYTLDDFQTQQINTSTDLTYSIMNEIYDSTTRNNYQSDGVYKFKMINSQGYELVWTQSGNPFDYTDEVPGIVNVISALNFTLSEGNSWDFDGLHKPPDQNWSFLDGITGNWRRYLIGQTQNSSAFSGEAHKLITISTQDGSPAHRTTSDWVELYCVVAPEPESELAPTLATGALANGPKENWKVEFLNIATGESLYSGPEIRTDSNGLFTTPSFECPHDIFEIYGSCVDSSGRDILTGITSTIGENLTAIGKYLNADYVHISDLSTLVASGLKASATTDDNGEIVLDTSIENLDAEKDKLQVALGITNIDANPYSDNTESTDAVAITAAILKVRSIRTAMQSILSVNSDKTAAEIQSEIDKSISLSLSSAAESSESDVVDLTSTSFLENAIESAGNAVVTNGTSVADLKQNAAGISSCVQTIETAVNNSSGDDLILELHKTQTAVEETISGGADLTTDVAAIVETTQANADHSAFSVPAIVIPEPVAPEPEPEPEPTVPAFIELGSSDSFTGNNVAPLATTFSSGTRSGFDSDYIIDENRNTAWVADNNHNIPGSIFIGLSFGEGKLLEGLKVTYNIFNRVSGTYKFYGTTVASPDENTDLSKWTLIGEYVIYGGGFSPNLTETAYKYFSFGGSFVFTGIKIVIDSPPDEGFNSPGFSELTLYEPVADTESEPEGESEVSGPVVLKSYNISSASTSPDDAITIDTYSNLKMVTPQGTPLNWDIQFDITFTSTPGEVYFMAPHEWPTNPGGYVSGWVPSFGIRGGSLVFRAWGNNNYTSKAIVGGITYNMRYIYTSESSNLEIIVDGETIYNNGMSDNHNSPPGSIVPLPDSYFSVGTPYYHTSGGAGYSTGSAFVGTIENLIFNHLNETKETMLIWVDDTRYLSSNNVRYPITAGTTLWPKDNPNGRIMYSVKLGEFASQTASPTNTIKLQLPFVYSSDLGYYFSINNSPSDNPRTDFTHNSMFVGRFSFANGQFNFHRRGHSEAQLTQNNPDFAMNETTARATITWGIEDVTVEGLDGGPQTIAHGLDIASYSDMNSTLCLYYYYSSSYPAISPIIVEVEKN